MSAQQLLHYRCPGPVPLSCLSTAPPTSFASVPARFQCSSRCHRSCRDARSKLASSRLPHIASPALSTGGSVRACRIAYDSLRMGSIVAKEFIPSVPARTRRSSHCQCRCHATHFKRARSPMTHFAWPAMLPGSSLQACPLALGGHPAADTAAKKLSPSVPARL